MNFQQYPNLFHKYLLNISNSTRPIDYTVKNRISDYKKYLCHIHIYDLDKYNSIFKLYEPNILRYFTIIITYSIGNGVFHENITYLKVENKGYDIGGKLCFYDYIKRNHLQYDYVLFLHSKTDPVKRATYFQPLMGRLFRLHEIHAVLEHNPKVFGIFPDIFWYNHNGRKNYTLYDVYISNERYLKDILDLLCCKNRLRIFAEGNCMILRKNVIDYVFEKYYVLFYNLLNIDNSFDYNWCRIFYKSNLSIDLLYQEYTQKKLYGNNNFLRDKSTNMPDGMFEHVFERIWINVIKELGGNYVAIDEHDEWRLRGLDKYFL